MSLMSKALLVLKSIPNLGLRRRSLTRKEYGKLNNPLFNKLFEITLQNSGYVSVIPAENLKHACHKEIDIVFNCMPLKVPSPSIQGPGV